MALDPHISADHETPPPASIDFEPTGYSQPTLPPPAVEPVSSREHFTFSSRWGTRMLGAGLAAVAMATVGAYAALPHGASPAAASAPVVTTVTAHLDQALATFSDAAPAPESCTELSGRIPLVLYSAIGAAVGGAVAPSASIESEIFVDATPVTERTLAVTGRRYAVLRTVDVHEPEAAVGEPSPGRYEAVLAVFDATSNTQLCRTVVRTWSSSSLMQHGVATRMLHEDLVSRARSAVNEAAQKLRVDLDM